MHIPSLIPGICSLLLLASCGGGEEPAVPGVTPGGDPPSTPEAVTVEGLTSDLTLVLATDRCAYQPGSIVTFNVTAGSLPADARVRYRHLGTIIDDQPLAARQWTWQLPAADFLGYLAEIYQPTAGSGTPSGGTGSTPSPNAAKILGTIAVDASSDWTTFPRYGFVATFDRTKTDAVIADEMKWLNRCHINGVQFQDWHLSHHWPCPIDHDGNLMAEYPDIANRTNLASVVTRYIDVQHAYGMKSIFYNLAFGALSDAPDDGVQPEWYIFRDAAHTGRDSHNLPASWKSNIFLTDPGNPDWQAYLADRNDEVYAHFDFDGYQIDQLGYRGPRYDYAGQPLDLPAGYASFIHAMKDRHPAKRLIMNAVSGYGAREIISTGQVDFCYNELWADQDQYADIYDVIRENDTFSDGRLRTVFAAYMDYECDRCEFNIPGVLLTDAVMMALGGQHLELGDHMLCREYFPYTGVRMSGDLRTAIERYYDFQVAYENLLRGPGRELQLVPSGTGKWPPVQGQITTFSREVEGKTVLHFLNFTRANSLSWRDLKGTMPEPVRQQDIVMSLPFTGKVSRLWVATPDAHAGAVQDIPFTHTAGTLTFTLPSLKYWTMLVIE